MNETGGSCTKEAAGGINRGLSGISCIDKVENRGPLYEQRDPVCSPATYPAVTGLRQNPIYARQMLGNIGSANSEMSAVSLYLYNALVTMRI